MRIDHNTVAVITGAANGIGRGIAIELARKKCHLALVDIDEVGLLQTQTEISPHTQQVSIHVVDVADRAAMASLPDAVLKKHSTINLLINNAGVSVAAPVEEVELDDFEWLMGINFWGVVYGCKFFIPHLKKSETAHICNILSDFAMFGLPTKSSYCASKFAARGFSESLRAELYGFIGLTCAYIGPVDTQLVRQGRVWDSKKQAMEADFVARRSIPVAKVAKKICWAIQKGKPRVLVGLETFLIDIAKRLFPETTTTLVARCKNKIPFL